MINLLCRLWCWLDGFHFVRRRPRIYFGEKGCQPLVHIHTEISCWCGLFKGSFCGSIKHEDAERLVKG